MSGLILLTFGVVGQWLLGFAVADWLIYEPAEPTTSDSFQDSLIEKTGLGFVLGIGCTAELLFLWSLIGGTLGLGISLAITAAGFGWGGFVFLHTYKQIQKLVPTTSSQDVVAERNWRRFCHIVIGLLFVVTMIQTLQTPQHLWDERASFAIKGIVLTEDKTIYSHDLADPNFVQYHPRYPLLIPLAEHHIYALLGRVDDRLSKLIFPLLYLGLILTMAGGLARHLTSGSAWLFALFAATMPVLVPWEYGFLCGQADASMACFHGTSALYVWNAWRVNSAEKSAAVVRSSLLAGLCGALAAFTKDEGIAFLMVDAIAVLLVICLSRRLLRGLLLGISIFGCAAIVLAPWMLHRQRLPLTTEANYFGRMSTTSLLQKQQNLAWEIPHLADRMFWEFRLWGLQWWLMLCGLVAAPVRVLAPSQMFLLLNVAGAIASLILAGMLAETEVSEHIGGSSHRYLMQLAPVAVLFAAGQLGQLRSDSTSGPSR